MTIIKKADKDDLASLGQIQSFIQKKTKTLDKVLALKGKIEMLQKTMELRKILARREDEDGEREVKTSKQPLLVYKDAEDEDEDMHDSQAEEEEDDEEDDEDEEIKEINLHKKSTKRQKKD